MKLLALLGLLVAVSTATLRPQEELKVPVLSQEEYILVVEEQGSKTAVNTKMLNITINDGTSIVEMPLEEYLVGVLLCEMPSSFHTEALKAQTVAARTFAARMIESPKHDDCTVCSNPSCCQAWKGRSEQEEIFGTKFASAWDKAEAAVEETAGQVLIYDGKLIEAVYFSCSGGASEPAAAVWGTDVPYLQSVSSPGEENAEKYETEVRVPFAQFKKILAGENAAVKFSVIPENWVGKTTYTEGGGVDEMVLGGISFRGKLLRDLFDLNSTNFTLAVGNGNIVFRVKGFGHRVGMSQYGADAMAENGSTYEEILHHYYTGVQIKDLS